MGSDDCAKYGFEELVGAVQKVDGNIGFPEAETGVPERIGTAEAAGAAGNFAALSAVRARPVLHYRSHLVAKQQEMVVLNMAALA